MLRNINHHLTSQTYRQRRAASRGRPLALGAAILMIVMTRLMSGMSVYVEAAALGGVILAVYIARSWWVSRMPWTRPGLSQVLFTVLMIVALLPGSALQMTGSAESERGDDRSIQEAAPATTAPNDQTLPAGDASVEQPEMAPVALVAITPVASQPIRTEEQDSGPVTVAPTVPVVVPTAQTAPTVAAPLREAVAPETVPVTIEATADVQQEPTPAVVPGLSLTATGQCAANGSYDVRITMVVFGAPALITDVLVVPSPGAVAMPWSSRTRLPATIAPGIVQWSWTIDPATVATETVQPTAVFVRAANMPGDAAAGGAIGSSFEGWTSAALPAVSRPCEAPAAPDVVNPRLARAGMEASTAETDTGEPTPASRESSDSGESTRSIREAGRSDEVDGFIASVATPRAASETPVASDDTTGMDSTPPSPTESETSIRIELLSPDENAAPGENVGYTFRVLNEGPNLQTVRLFATNSAEGWSSTVSVANSDGPLAAPVELGTGQFIDVIVTVRVPEGAKVSTSNDTTLRANIVGEIALGPSAEDPSDIPSAPTSAEITRSIRR